METLPVQEPLLKISDVAAATGLAPALLRAWERRYGFPETARTAGGQRLYSLKEVERIREVQGLVARGFAISQAVAAVRCVTRVDRGLAEVRPGEPLCSSLVDRLYTALVAFRADEAADIASHVVDSCGLATFVDGVLAPTMRRVGDDWAAGVVGIDQEHFASSWASALIGRHTAPATPTRERLVLACVEAELHCIGIQALHVALVAEGFDAYLLGPSVPTSALLAMIRRIRPDAVLLSVSTPGHLRVVERVAEGVAALPRDRRARVGYGGSGVEDAPEVRGAQWIGSSLADALEVLPVWLAQTG